MYAPMFISFAITFSCGSSVAIAFNLIWLLHVGQLASHKQP